MPSYKLTYLVLRARGEPIRMLFALADVPFENVRVSWEDWPEVKKTTPFGHVPVLEVDGKQIPQSIAILRYLAKEFGFYGNSRLEEAMVDAVADQFVDFRGDYKKFHRVNVGYEEGDKEKLFKEVWLPARAKHFPIFQRLIQQNPNGWLVGNSITFADLLLASRMESLELTVPDIEAMYEGFPELKAHKEKVFALPKLQKHLASRPSDKW